MTEHFAVDWKSCEVHCWCALNEADYPEHSAMHQFTKVMKETSHDHGDKTTCTGCMVDDRRITSRYILFNFDKRVYRG